MTMALQRRTLVQIISVWGFSLAGQAGVAASPEEPLSDAMRSLLRQRWVGGTVMPFDTDLARRWQAAVDAPLSQWIASQTLRQEFKLHLAYEAQRAGLSLSLMLGLVEVESGFRKHAISPAGAMGYGQVMPFWTRLIGDGDPSSLLETQANLRYACLILRHYLDMEKGDLVLALGRYNGTRGWPHYPERVLQAREKWRLEID